MSGWAPSKHTNLSGQNCACFAAWCLVVNCALIIQALAVDISLAALLGENIYNFGELLLHPIVSIAHKACTSCKAVPSCLGHNDICFTLHLRVTVKHRACLLSGNGLSAQQRQLATSQRAYLRTRCLQIEVLDTSKDYRWLKEMLECFHAGDLHKYDELCSKHKSVLNNQPALTENVHQLRQKITILCLMELIFRSTSPNCTARHRSNAAWPCHTSDTMHGLIGKVWLLCQCCTNSGHSTLVESSKQHICCHEALFVGDSMSTPTITYRHTSVELS